MIIKTFPVGAFGCNCTIIVDPVTGDTIVVDPGDEGDRIAKEVNALGGKVKYLLHTHAHLDHIGATKLAKKTLGGEICLHKDDQFLYDNIAMQGQFLGITLDSDVLPIDHYLIHGDSVACRNFRADVIHTPGHTPGSLCFRIPDITLGTQKHDLLFAGDTLFAGSIGRTDLWGGDYDQIIASIKERLLSLDGNTIVVCGHGPNTSIGREVKSNPFVGG